MLPSELAKSGTEHAHQCAVFAWANMAARYGIKIADLWASGMSFENIATCEPIPILEWLFAIPNGGDRGDTIQSRKIHGGAMKAEGVKPGVHDIFLPHAAHGCHGLFIEMKKPTGIMSKEQKDFQVMAKIEGFAAVTCYSWIEAVNILKSYLS